MKKSPKLWKQILFGLIAFIFVMFVFISAVILRSNSLKNEASKLTEDDFVTEKVVVDSAYVEYLYHMPISESLKQYVEPSLAEITFSVQNSPITFRSPQFIPKSTSLGSSAFSNLNLKSGDTISILFKRQALEEAKHPNFLSNFYHRYRRPLVYAMSNKKGLLYDIGMKYDQYIDDKIHNESVFYAMICVTIIGVGIIGFKFNFIKR